MTRNEQIYFEIDKRKHWADCPFDYEDGFKRGVEWADKHPKSGMVNKDEFVSMVRNWLEKHTYDDKYWTPDGEDLFLGNLIGDICKYLEE